MDDLNLSTEEKSQHNIDSLDVEFDLDMAGTLEGTDKSSTVNPAWDYLRSFERYFVPFRDATINFIEIGVLGGSSLAIWRKFFLSATVVGIDYDKRCMQFARPGVEIRIGSQDDPVFLRKVANEFPPTIVIDDGSHQAAHMVYTFEQLFPTLEPGGIYIVEDIGLHVGPNKENWNKEGAQSPIDYFAGLAKSVISRTILSGPTWGTSRYIFDNIASIDFIRGAVVIRKESPRDTSKAVRYAESLLKEEASSKNPEYHLRLAEYVIRHGGLAFSDAEAHVDKAAAITGETQRTHSVRSSLMKKTGRLMEATQQARKAAEIGNDYGSWAVVASLERNQRNTSGAIDALNRALQALPGGHPRHTEILLEIEQLNKRPLA